MLAHPPDRTAVTSRPIRWLCLQQGPPQHSPTAHVHFLPCGTNRVSHGLADSKRPAQMDFSLCGLSIPGSRHDIRAANSPDSHALALPSVAADARASPMSAAEPMRLSAM